MREWPTLIGQKYGMLTVTGQAESSPSGRRRWICRCDCGNETIVLGGNLKRGTTVSCGCKKRSDLTGQRRGRLMVLERSDRYGDRGNRRTRLWKCRCDCGAITYKATDVLTNPQVSMCQECAATYAITRAREKAGFEDGTQISRIRDVKPNSSNASGMRGVYLDPKTGRYRARLKFQGKIYNLGSYTCLEDAVKARRQGEEEIYGTYLAEKDTMHS